MALRLPPSLTIKAFTGGYRAVADYTDLADTETNDAENVLYGLDANIDQRPGSLKLLNERLVNTATLSANTGVFSAGQNILGHYWYDKIESTSSYHVVGAGTAIYSYTSETANAIRTNLSAVSTSFYTFVQIRNPSSGSADMLLLANGVDAIQVWNGTGTCVALSSLTSATAVPVAAYVAEHKGRVIATGISDASDVRAMNRVDISGFGTDQLPDPHRFSVAAGGGSIYCGSGHHGSVTGIKILQDQIIVYTRKSTWRVEIGSSAILDIAGNFEIQRSVGCLAPHSLVSMGNLHIFLSEQGVYGFDGTQFLHISKDVDEDLFTNSNQSALQYAKGVYYKRENQYHLYYAGMGSSRNNKRLIYDLREGMKLWQPPLTGREVSFVSTFDVNGIEQLIYGDYAGYLYQDNTGDNDGIATGYNGTVTAAGASTVTVSTQEREGLLTTRDGLAGLMVHIIGGTGEGQMRVIASNTGFSATAATTNGGGVITVDSPWATQPDTTSLFSVAGIQAYWRSKDYDFGAADIAKLFRHVRVRPREEGNYNLTMYYIVDFKALSQATARDLNLLDTSAAWDTSTWDTARFGGLPVIIRRVSLRNTDSQRMNGTHLALRFSNLRANERFRLTGFDLEMQPRRGKR